MKKLKASNPDIRLSKVRVHNVHGSDITIPAGKLVVLTGVSGSGKSSIAFDTIYAEGQRRYVESLSNYARRFLGGMARPDVESVTGLTPTISVEQKTAGRNPRSTVGTMTEIYDYLRVLFARVGVPHCPISGEPVEPQSRERIIAAASNGPEGRKLVILAPFAKAKKAAFKEEFEELIRKGFMRARVDGQILDLSESVELDPSKAHTVEVVIDRLVRRPADSTRLAESLTAALEQGDGTCIVHDMDEGEDTLYSTHAYSPASGTSYSALDPQDFSFNSPAGMCGRCEGLGRVQDFALSKIIDPDLSIADDCCSIASSYQTVYNGNVYDNLARIGRFDITTPWKQLPKRAQQLFLYGTEKKWTKMQFIHPQDGRTWTDHVKWRGVLEEARKRYSNAKSDSYRRRMEKLMVMGTCPECDGDRLKPYPRATKLAGATLGELCRMSIQELQQYFHELKLEGVDYLVGAELVKEIEERLRFLTDVGLEYLTLNRPAPTLSGGEAQRVRLASQIGCGLVGVTYILDEPSIGLHPRDNRKLIQTLCRLRDMGNTVLVVEHDEETIRKADHIIDIGPAAGARGGEVTYAGSFDQFKTAKRSITADFLFGRKCIEVPKKRRKSNGHSLKLKGACHHNLQNANVDIPLGLFVAVTGVSGSGKSSLISDILYPALANQLQGAELDVGEHSSLEGVEHLDKVISIDQSPIGRNPRSNPATYVKVFDEIRSLFALLPESKARGYDAGRFSFNVAEGSCRHCQGMGMVKVDMDFLEDSWVECDRCHGRRFDQDTLSIHYKGKTIFDVLEMEIGDALTFFQDIPKLCQKLRTLCDVGLDYIKLGQPSPTLSGGEAQRIKLAKELSRPTAKNTLYLLDEPTTGLHFHDIGLLLKVLHQLVDRGNTVLVIEHNMDVVKTADWILDIGPEGGQHGGKLVAKGKPEAIAKKESPTGLALKEALHPHAHTISSQATDTQLSVSIDQIAVRKAEQHNLKRVNLDIPRGSMTVFTGPSGSGKSSLAIDTVYAEGQRRYTDSLSPYARQYVQQMPKPVVESIEGLSPAIAVEQQVHAGSARSTVGTMTEVYDFMRLLYARIGIPHCPESGEVIQAVGKETVVEKILNMDPQQRIIILAPLDPKEFGGIEEAVNKVRRLGFLRIRLDGQIISLDQEQTIPVSPGRKHILELVVDRVKVGSASKARLGEAIETAERFSKGVLTVATEDEEQTFNLRFSAPTSGKSYPPITPNSFSFNRPEGMCPHCQGLGVQYGIDLKSHPLFANLTPLTLMETLWDHQWNAEAELAFEELMALLKIPSDVALCKQKPAALTRFMQGDSNRTIKQKHGMRLAWPGVNTVMARVARTGSSNVKTLAVDMLEEHTCPDCQGGRVNTLARHVTIHDTNIAQLCAMPIKDARAFILSLQLDEKEAALLEEPLAQVRSRLHFLEKIGLHYLSLDRPARTLSGGETQRIRLARQLGSSLGGVLYVLDEPTIGLHPHDIDRLHWALDSLKDLGNTLLLVEHDPQTIAHADRVVDFGPAAGQGGGQIMFEGTYKQLLRSKASLTGAYLSGRKQIGSPKEACTPAEQVITMKKCALHNLRSFDVTIPIGQMTCVTGVSGSGKSTLIEQLLLPAATRAVQGGQADSTHANIKGLDCFEKVIFLDQKPIGGTSRADVGTYAEILPPLRALLAQMPAARQRGLQPGHFSFNHRKGMCHSCWGMGYRKIEMHFLPAIQVPCEACHGKRLNQVSLGVTYLGKDFGDLLECTLEELRQLCANHRPIVRILDTLISVGLGYLKLGQRMATLSGGEAQRLKLSRELAKRSSGRTLYILDEPTSGLHSDDIAKLMLVLEGLVAKGNTMVVVEHNLDLIARADWIIDLGPAAGEEGGQLMYCGEAQGFRGCKQSLTAGYLSQPATSLA